MSKYEEKTLSLPTYSDWPIFFNDSRCALLLSSKTLNRDQWKMMCCMCVACVLTCKCCGIWQRDINAARNMHLIARVFLDWSSIPSRCYLSCWSWSLTDTFQAGKLELRFDLPTEIFAPFVQLFQSVDERTLCKVKLFTKVKQKFTHSHTLTLLVNS